MKEAHKLTKGIKKEYPEVDYITQLGICIAYLSENKGEVKMVELKGSEKQIKWAEDIRANFIKKLEEVKGLKIEHEEFSERLSNEVTRSIGVISKIEKASTLIEYRDNVKFIESSLKKLAKGIDNYTLKELKKYIWSFTYEVSKNSGLGNIGEEF
jgi:hypothetical protein